MVLIYLFDRIVAFIGLLFLWPVLVVVAILVKVKMPGGPVFFVQKRVGKDGKLYDCHKFRTMRVQSHTESTDNTEKTVSDTNDTTPLTGSGTGSASTGWSTVSVAGDSRITPLGAKLRHWKLDELPGLWDVFIGKMSFVGPRPDVPGYADKLTGDDRDVLKLRPGITGPATLKYRLEDEMIAEWVAQIRSHTESTDNTEKAKANTDGTNNTNMLTQEEIDRMSDQEVAVWYNDNVIYPDKVRLNCYYYRHYSFVKDIQMILCTVLGKKMKYNGELI